MPPGFFLEDEVAFQSIADNIAFLDAGLVRLPMREERFSDLIEKKRSEYASVSPDFPGLFNDDYLRIFDEIAPYFDIRQTRVGVSATERWRAGPDVDANWSRIKCVMSHEAIERCRRAPTLLRDEGAALTWPGLTKFLDSEGLHYQSPVRVALQQNYFEIYTKEYGLTFLTDLPHNFDRLIPDGSDRGYSFRLFGNLLTFLGIEPIWNLPTEQILILKQSAGWALFADAFVQIAAEPPSGSVLTAFGSGPKSAHVRAIGKRLLDENLPRSLTDILLELTQALADLADDVSRRFRLLVRADYRASEASMAASFEPFNNPNVVEAGTTGRGARRLRHVFIGTSNTNEYKAALDVFRAAATDGLELNVEFGRPVKSTTLTILSKSGQLINIDIAIARETGGRNAADLMSRAVRYFNCDAVFFVGCAGLLYEKYGVDPHEISDLVVVAKRAHDGEARLITDVGTTYDGESFAGSGTLIESLRVMEGMGRFEPMQVLTNRDFISTSAFHASKTSEERQALVDNFVRDAIVIENEALAVYDAGVRLSEESGRHIHSLVVKGISDLGDADARVDKIKKQGRAARNAASVVLRLLQEQ